MDDPQVARGCPTALSRRLADVSQAMTRRTCGHDRTRPGTDGATWSGSGVAAGPAGATGSGRSRHRPLRAGRPANPHGDRSRWLGRRKAGTTVVPRSFPESDALSHPRPPNSDRLDAARRARVGSTESGAGGRDRRSRTWSTETSPSSTPGVGSGQVPRSSGESRKNGRAACSRPTVPYSSSCVSSPSIDRALVRACRCRSTRSPRGAPRPGRAGCGCRRRSPC